MSEQNFGLSFFFIIFTLWFASNADNFSKIIERLAQ